MLLQMKRAIPWRMKMNLLDDFVSNGEPFSMHVRKALGTFTMRKFCALFSKLLRTSRGLLTKLSLMTFLPPKRTQPLDLTVFPTVSTDVLGAWVRNSSFTPIKPLRRKVLFPIVLLKVGLSLSQRLLIPMTSEGFFVHLMHFVR